MDYTKNKESWDAGFRAGYYQEKPGNDNGFAHDFFVSGYAEGKAKRNGKISQFFVDDLGQVQFTMKVRADHKSARYFQEIIL